MSHYYDHDDDDYRPPETRWEDQWGCLFPAECCMPGEHQISECYTAEEYEAMMREAQDGGLR